MIRASAASRICPKPGTLTFGRGFAAAYPCRGGSVDNALVRGAMMAVLSSSFEGFHEDDGGSYLDRRGVCARRPAAWRRHPCQRASWIDGTDQRHRERFERRYIAGCRCHGDADEHWVHALGR